MPQNSFLPRGTLLEILTYPLKPEEFLDSSSDFVLNNNSYDNSYGEGDPLITLDENTYGINQLIDRVAEMLVKVDLIPGSIVRHEISAENINWSDRLSGGEKQKIAIIRFLLTDKSFLVMDESTSALDAGNKKTVYSLIKEYFTVKEEYMVIYIEHGSTPGFADNRLIIEDHQLTMLSGDVEGGNEDYI